MGRGGGGGGGVNLGEALWNALVVYRRGFLQINRAFIAGLSRLVQAYHPQPSVANATYFIDTTDQPTHHTAPL